MYGVPANGPRWWGLWLGRAVTLLAVIVAWVFFRAASFDAAILMLEAMAGLNGIVLPPQLAAVGNLPLADALGITVGELPLFTESQVVLTGLLFLIALFAPNTQEWICDRSMPAAAARSLVARIGRWVPNPTWAAAAMLFVYTLIQLSNISEFLYFQF